MRHALLAFALLLAGCDQSAPSVTTTATTTTTTTTTTTAKANPPARLVIEAKFDEAAQFAEGLAAVRVGGKYGYIDKSGQTVIAPQFDFANPFSEGVAAAGAAGVVVDDVDRNQRTVPRRNRLTIASRITAPTNDTSSDPMLNEP